MMNNTLLCMSLLLLSGIIQTTYGVNPRLRFRMSTSAPQVCKYGEHTIPVGEEYNDTKLCRQYTCNKTENLAENQLVIETCDKKSLNLRNDCYLADPPQGTPYPECCDPKIICPPTVQH